MKKLLTLAVALVATLSASAQLYYTDSANKDMLRFNEREGRQRVEMVLPQVRGFNIYKADLHNHTIFSDGSVTPEFRIKEAWHDGLDVIAVTEHVEYRPYEGKMMNFLTGYVPKDIKPANSNVIRSEATDAGILSDLNYPVKLYQAAAKAYGITVIPGAEITREPTVIGHYNALFTKDNNTIYAKDPMQSIRNAKAQGAIVMQNHPGWRRTTLDMMEFEEKVYAANLIDGIEIVNGGEFYPRAITRAQKNKFFMASNTDIHGSTAEDYVLGGDGTRNMTFIFAQENTLEALREALEARRTLAYSHGTLAGEESLLVDLFKASVATKVIQKAANGSKTVQLTNNSSIKYTLRFGNANPVILNPFTSIRATSGKDGKLAVKVENMWCGEDAHPVVEWAF
ncbi:MAG: PHP domain-containing protein [Rikenellaceae bacterium]|nr:PHP domain-containing protein [Rikenellaceae bacterium]